MSTKDISNIPKYLPERLSLWDRWFNRYRREIWSRGSETWHKQYQGSKLAGSEYQETYVEYLVIDRLTGSVTIKKEYD